MIKHPNQWYTLQLLQLWLSYPSITPQDAGIMDEIESVLSALGFTCHIIKFEEPGQDPVLNMYARLGTTEPNLCFAGHVDVVPPGDIALWSQPPFGGNIVEQRIYGRGTVDMKGAIAAFIGAVKHYLATHTLNGSISLLITGDEEGAAINGTVKMLDWLKSQGEHLSACLVGEPTSQHKVGDTIKVGRRGSANFTLTVHGMQGHVAYPDLANNPISKLLAILHALDHTTLDKGTEMFSSSNLEITSIDVGNSASNVIPSCAQARFNIRFNNLHTAASLLSWVHRICQQHSHQYELHMQSNADAFISKAGRLRKISEEAVHKVLGFTPQCSTSGGTSDARFIHQHCETLELGACNAMAHKVDEHILLSDLYILEELYYAILQGYLEK